MRDQSRPDIDAKRLTISQRLKMGPVLLRGRIATNRDVHSLPIVCRGKWCGGWGRPTTGSGRTRARKGRGPIAYPTGKLFEARTGCLNEAMTHFRYEFRLPFGSADLLFLREAVAKSANTKKPQRSLAQHDK